MLRMMRCWRAQDKKVMTCRRVVGPVPNHVSMSCWVHSPRCRPWSASQVRNAIARVRRCVRVTAGRLTRPEGRALRVDLVAIRVVGGAGARAWLNGVAAACAVSYAVGTETLTFLFTDIEGSTALLGRLGGDAYAGVLADQRALIRAGLAARSGKEGTAKAGGGA
jgi:hypothetical protein